jgi:hypothetical protein
MTMTLFVASCTSAPDGDFVGQRLAACTICVVYNKHYVGILLVNR